MVASIFLGVSSSNKMPSDSMLQQLILPSYQGAGWNPPTFTNLQADGYPGDGPGEKPKAMEVDG